MGFLHLVLFQIKAMLTCLRLTDAEPVWLIVSPLTRLVIWT